jgi:hypothetical protein
VAVGRGVLVRSERQWKCPQRRAPPHPDGIRPIRRPVKEKYSAWVRGGEGCPRASLYVKELLKAILVQE